MIHHPSGQRRDPWHCLGMQRDPTTVFFAIPTAGCAKKKGARFCTLTCRSHYIPSVVPFPFPHHPPTPIQLPRRRKIFTLTMTTTSYCSFGSIPNLLGTTFAPLAMVTRSTLPGPNPQCDRIAQCVSNVASTLRLPASSLDEIHDILRGQPPPAPTMGYPPVLQQPLGLLAPMQTTSHPTPPPTATHHFRGNLQTSSCTFTTWCFHQRR